MQVTLVPNFQIEYSIQLANGLSELVDLTFVVWEKLAPEIMDLLDKRISVVRLGSPGDSIGPRIATEGRIYHFLRSHPSDVVHFQNAFVWRLPLLGVLGRKKSVVTIHDPAPHQGLPDPWSFLAIALSAARADALITLGPRQREVLLARFNLSRRLVFVIPHGEFSFFGRFSSAHSSDKLTILFIGRIASYKGLENFLEAIPLIAKQSPSARFRIVGTGDLDPYRALIRGLPNLEVENRRVSYEEMGREIEQAAIVVAPYLEASQSGVVIAAQSMGRPVVVSDVGGLRDDVIPGETAILVRPRDPKGLASAVTDLLRNPGLREAMGRRAREWMATARSWRAVARDTVAVYEVLE